MWEIQRKLQSLGDARTQIMLSTHKPQYQVCIKNGLMASYTPHYPHPPPPPTHSQER